jgi:hypothetical protein
MPFPLAHPAAVLPLRRVQALCFPALVLGSLTPDFGYLFADLSRLSHHLLGSLLFCLPAGLLAYLQLIRRTTGSWRLFDAREVGRYVIWVCVLVVPLILVTVVTTAHAGTWSWRRTLSVFVYQSLAVYLVALGSLLTLIGFALRVRQLVLPRSTSAHR